MCHVSLSPNFGLRTPTPTPLSRATKGRTSLQRFVHALLSPMASVVDLVRSLSLGALGSVGAKAKDAGPGSGVPRSSTWNGLLRSLSQKADYSCFATTESLSSTSAPVLPSSPARREPARRDGYERFEEAVLQHLNWIRQHPQEAATSLRLLLSENYYGKRFAAPWLPEGVETLTKEGREALDSLVSDLEQLQPLEPLQISPELRVAPQIRAQELASGTTSTATLTLERRLQPVGTWAGVAGEVVVRELDQPDAIVTTSLLDDGNLLRVNRRILLNPDVRLAAFASAVGQPRSVFGGGLFSSWFGGDDSPPGTISVLTVVSRFFPAPVDDVEIECEGPVTDDDPMPRAMESVLCAVPSDEVAISVKEALDKGMHVKLEYWNCQGAHFLRLTITDPTAVGLGGEPAVQSLTWT